MNHSPEINEIAKALATAQGEFPAVPKTNDNPFFKAKYADLAAVKAVADPIITKHGLSVTQLIGFDENGDTLTTILLHSSGQYFSEAMRLRPVKNDPQAQGSAVTYGKRYSYMAILGLVADEDDDGNAASKGSNAKSGNAASLKQTVAKKADPETGEVTSGDGPTEGQKKFAASLFRGKGLEGAGEQAEFIQGVIGRAVPFDEVSKREASTIVDALKNGGS